MHRTDAARGAGLLEGDESGESALGRWLWLESIARTVVAVLICVHVAVWGASASEPERDREIERGDQLEDQIQSELERQEQLLDEMRAREAARKDAAKKPPSAPGGGRALADRADPRIAPMAPEDRELPLEIFDRQEKTVAPGAWGHDRELEVIV